MGKDPTTENSSASTLNSIESVLANTGVQAVEALILVQVPFLGLPVIKQIWEMIFGWIASYFIQAIQLGTTFVVIDIQTASEENTLSTALQNLIAAEKTGDASAIQSALQAYAQAQSSLIHSDGSSPPPG